MTAALKRAGALEQWLQRTPGQSGGHARTRVDRPGRALVLILPRSPIDTGETGRRWIEQRRWRTPEFGGDATARFARTDSQLLRHW